ncbi:WbuC family cupin fold metalloprotein [Marivibrio halodurans]|uniref:WbuC family cupin fold metalloprotein n=1 Tax=Marivibrio halodurans TaxID=2039722 RepID=A0A8J7SKP0_9PROT|nr:WbuC family cupin fold metalloprotein [Marivibrio halodurans]MBP5855636.1 WbuC family cupin fold metalloprotein [Marivibrio halodurans]
MADSTAFRQVAAEVYYSVDSFATAGPEAVAMIKRIALESPRKRCRICFHPGPEATAQEMLIAMAGRSYVRPHRHFGKSETLTVLEGSATALLFGESGEVTRRVPMGPHGQGRTFFYRMPEGIFHTLDFESDIFVYLETTTGPFDPAKSEGAAWAPPESDPEAGFDFIRGLDA